MTKTHSEYITNATHLFNVFQAEYEFTGSYTVTYHYYDGELDSTEITIEGVDELTETLNDEVNEVELTSELEYELIDKILHSL